MELPIREFQNLAKELGHSKWQAQSPAGYSDLAEMWNDPDSLYKRTEFAQRLAQMADLESLMDDAGIFGLAKQVTEMRFPGFLQGAITTRMSKVEALALMIAGPDFQWR